MDYAKVDIEKNYFLAGLWFVISIAIAFSAIATAFSEEPLLSIPILGMAYIVFMLGRQRTSKYYLKERVFDNRLLWVGYGSALFCGWIYIF